MLLACGAEVSVNPFEHQLMLRWHKEGKSTAEIAELLQRGHGTVSRHLRKVSTGKARVGRPQVVTPAVWRKLNQALQRLQKRADAEKEVTLPMVIAEAGVEVSTRAVQRAFRQHDVKFYKLRERPVLQPGDIRERKTWAQKRARRSAAQWTRMPHAIIDNKVFPVFGTRGGRSIAARRSVRGAYRAPGAEPEPWLVKTKSTMKPGAPGVMVAAAVIKSRIRMWHYIRGPWNGAAAADMYKGPLRAALKRAYPTCRTHTVLEDNDPTGYKSSQGKAAKRESNIITDDLPKRSPDLNVLDYSLWHAINVRMRAQEASFPSGKRETQAEFLARLRKTALGLPQREVGKAVQDMRRRVALVWARNGKLFTE